MLRTWSDTRFESEGVESMHTGEQTPNTSKSWFAIKVFYNKVLKLQARLNEQNIESYIPMKSVEQIVGGHKIRRRKPAISSLMFVQCTENEASELQALLRGEALLYTNRGEKSPAPIPDDQMRTFISVTSIDDIGMEYLGDITEGWTTGERVRVIDGIFKGAEGYIKRIKGNHRLIVAIEGIVAVATSYIPSCYLEKVEQN